METIVNKKLKGSVMENVFDSTKTVNIRHYKAKSADNYNPEETYTFEINVRHNEDEDPKELLNKAIKELKPKP